mmetsp:Transcript_98492/g.219930  ORF Transcript_98492/g.219930 Transcript_98492/m.219930 type:complete len:246 (+) Transcript_98492:196-933(+)
MLRRSPRARRRVRSATSSPWRSWRHCNSCERLASVCFCVPRCCQSIVYSVSCKFKYRMRSSFCWHWDFQWLAIRRRCSSWKRTKSSAQITRFSAAEVTACCASSSLFNASSWSPKRSFMFLKSPCKAIISSCICKTWLSKASFSALKAPVSRRHCNSARRARSDLMLLVAAAATLVAPRLPAASSSREGGGACGAKVEPRGRSPRAEETVAVPWTCLRRCADPPGAVVTSRNNVDSASSAKRFCW